MVQSKYLPATFWGNKIEPTDPGALWHSISRLIGFVRQQLNDRIDALEKDEKIRLDKKKQMDDFLAEIESMYRKEPIINQLGQLKEVMGDDFVKTYPMFDDIWNYDLLRDYTNGGTKLEDMLIQGKRATDAYKDYFKIAADKYLFVANERDKRLGKNPTPEQINEFNKDFTTDFPEYMPKNNDHYLQNRHNIIPDAETKSKHLDLMQKILETTNSLPRPNKGVQDYPINDPANIQYLEAYKDLAKTMHEPRSSSAVYARNSSNNVILAGARTHAGELNDFILSKNIPQRDLTGRVVGFKFIPSSVSQHTAEALKTIYPTMADEVAREIATGYEADKVASNLVDNISLWYNKLRISKGLGSPENTEGAKYMGKMVASALKSRIGSNENPDKITIDKNLFIKRGPHDVVPGKIDETMNPKETTTAEQEKEPETPAKPFEAPDPMIKMTDAIINAIQRNSFQQQQQQQQTQQAEKQKLEEVNTLLADKRPVYETELEKNWIPLLNQRGIRFDSNGSPYKVDFKGNALLNTPDDLIKKEIRELVDSKYGNDGANAYYNLESKIYNLGNNVRTNPIESIEDFSKIDPDIKNTLIAKIKKIKNLPQEEQEKAFNDWFNPSIKTAVAPSKLNKKLISDIVDIDPDIKTKFPTIYNQYKIQKPTPEGTEPLTSYMEHGKQSIIEEMKKSGERVGLHYNENTDTYSDMQTGRIIEPIEVNNRMSIYKQEQEKTRQASLQAQLKARDEATQKPAGLNEIQKARYSSSPSTIPKPTVIHSNPIQQKNNMVGKDIMNLLTLPAEAKSQKQPTTQPKQAISQPKSPQPKTPQPQSQTPQPKKIAPKKPEESK